MPAGKLSTASPPTTVRFAGSSARTSRAPLTRAAGPGPDNLEGRQYRFGNHDADLVDVDAVLGTSDDQIAVTTGTLVREWRENGRRYFHYKTEAPVAFGIPVLSAKYAVRENRWKDVALKVFYHPAHTFNVDRMVRSMQASLEYYTREFGPYQFNELRIVEFPRYATFARAHPQTIAFSEGSAFLTRVDSGDVDRPFFVTAHEAAHQWWGGQVSGARVQGAALLTETLAMYSSMMVMEKTYGREQVKKFYDFEMDFYFRGRNADRDSEVPLLRASYQQYLYYHKGAVAMYTLKETIGEAQVNRALRAYLAKWRSAGPPYPTSLDLYKEFQAVAPDSLKPLLTDLFETITLYRVGVERASAERVGANAYRVTMDVMGKKVRSDSAGNETDTPMDEMVEIGVFAGDNERKPLGEPLYLGKHRIKSGRQTITVVVQRQPGRIGVDPNRWLVQRARDVRVVALKELISKSRSGPTAWRAEYLKPRRDLTPRLKGI